MENNNDLDLLLAIVGERINSPEVIAEGERIQRLTDSLEPCTVYQLNEKHEPDITVCTCTQEEDARDIALFFQTRDGAKYRYWFTDSKRTPHAAWAWKAM